MSDPHGVLFSLIIPTLHRRGEVSRLLHSIEAQSCHDYEVILVDQNPHDLIGDVCRDFAQRMPLLHLKTESKGASHARNHGLSFAKGTIINFPDDDCEFTPELLTRVRDYLAGHPEMDALFARAIDPITGESSVTKFDSQSQRVTAANLYRTTVEFTMFARRTLFDEVGVLDESLSPGTFYGAEEGADFVLRAIYRKADRLYYDSALLIHHEQKVATYDAKERLRAYNYGKGFGRMSLKHARRYRQPGAVLRFFKFQFRASVAVVLFLILLQPKRAAYYFMLLRGRMEGVIRSWSEFAKHSTSSDR